MILSGSKRSEADGKAAALLEQVGLAERVEHFPDQLSGGEQQRVALARALIAEPALVLADEPTGNLDSATTAAIGALLQQLHSQSASSLVLITHELEVAAWADRVIILADGQMVDDFTRAEAEGAAAIAERYRASTEAAKAEPVTTSAQDSQP